MTLDTIYMYRCTGLKPANLEWYGHCAVGWGVGGGITTGVWKTMISESADHGVQYVGRKVGWNRAR